MRVVVQRVSKAAVDIDGKRVASIGRGALIFLGVAKEDAAEDAEYLVRKVSQLRIFADQDGKMNLAADEVGAAFLVVSQFTLYGSCRKGRRPSFDEAADPKKGEELYEAFVQCLRAQNVQVETGQFGAMMDVSLVNDGPVTFILESNSRTQDTYH